MSGELKSYFERWERLEEAKAEVAEDLRELFAEAKSTGFEPKAMRLAFRQKAKAENETDKDRELAALVDLYLSEIDAPRARPAPAHEKTLKNFQSDREHAVPVVREPVEGSADETSTPDAPEALVNDEPSPEAGPQAEASPAGTGAGTPADREGRHEGEAASAGLPANPPDPRTSTAAGGQRSIPSVDAGDADRAGDEPGHHDAKSTQAATNSEQDDKRASALRLRPNCQHPGEEICGGQGSNHCHACEKAARQNEAAA